MTQAATDGLALKDPDDVLTLPILMHARSIRGTQSGAKTQTRRVVKTGKGQPDLHPDADRIGFIQGKNVRPVARFRNPDGTVTRAKSPYGGRGDHLWVRETYQLPANLDDTKPSACPPDSPVRYHADNGIRQDLETPSNGAWGKIRPSIHIPKWASRYLLLVHEVRVERVQDISVEDILAEGVQIGEQRTGHPLADHDAYRAQWQRLWNDTNKHRLDRYGWDQNPWVWVVTYTVITSTWYGGQPPASSSKEGETESP